MRNFGIALWAEYMKIRKSRIFYITVALFVFIPLMLGLMIYIVRHPEISARLGIVAAKANMFGTTDWPGFLGLINQTMAAMGLIGFGFVTAWVYGREYTDHTLKDILALPVSRATIVLAKFAAVAIWCVILSLVLVLTSLLIAHSAHLSGFSKEIWHQSIATYSVICGLTILLCTPVAFFAGYGRGLIAPLGFVIVTLIVAQFTAVSGFGPFFPWAIPGLLTTAGTADEVQLVAASYVLFSLTSLVGLLGTVAWWERADHK
jgi:ABC-2 type transport system permease protein